jgi:hypothetical protein
MCFDLEHEAAIVHGALAVKAADSAQRFARTTVVLGQES